MLTVASFQTFFFFVISQAFLCFILESMVFKYNRVYITWRIIVFFTLKPRRNVFYNHFITFHAIHHVVLFYSLPKAVLLMRNSSHTYSLVVCISQLVCFASLYRFTIVSTWLLLRFVVSFLFYQYTYKFV
jgi:hypothetical protein